MSIGSYLRNHPRLLERSYRFAHWSVYKLNPLLKRIGYERVARVLTPAEKLSKEVIFDCRMCGQCVLHSTGMTCPMTCPKNLRNGPCGGVRANGNCEVIPDMKCVWVEAFERSKQMGAYGGEMLMVQPPVNRQLQDQSAWLNMLTGDDKEVPKGWVGLDSVAVVPKKTSPYA